MLSVLTHDTRDLCIRTQITVSSPQIFTESGDPFLPLFFFSFIIRMDDVVDLEGQEFAKGYDRGRVDGRQTCRLRGEGARQGFLKGFAIGFEAGFLAAAGSYAVEDGRTFDAASGSGSADRLRRKAEELREKASAIPDHNTPEIDFDAEIQASRLLYKQMGAIFGPCPPSLTAQSQPVPSHEW